MDQLKTPLRILLVEDNESDGALVIRHLSKSDFEISFTRVETGSDFRKELENSSWDIVISDYSLPQFNALVALRILQESGIDIPFIVVSGTIGEETAVEMMRSGAQDYLMKNNLTRLIPAVTRELSDARVRHEHKHAEIARLESEEKFRAVFENSVDAIGISLHGIHVFINPAYATLFGYKNDDEILGLPIINLIAPEERTRILSFIKKRSTDPATPGEYETRGLRKDGTVFDMEVRVTLLEINREIHTLVIIRNITVRKRAEEQLLEAKLKEEESSLMKSTLMMNMSHEVRTPLNAILGFSSIISIESGEPDIRQMAERISISGERLLKTLDDILELTQLQSGVIEMKLETTDLEKELTSLINKYTSFATRKNISLGFSCQDKVFAPIQKSLFEKAIGEIVVNAIKFTGTGRVDVELRNVIIGGVQMAEIKVIDSGIGIAKEHQAVIFESFRQVSGGYNRSHEGTGLGLTISKKIVEMLQGEIFVESEVGTGSRFTVRIPCTSLTGQPVKHNDTPKIKESEPGSLPADSKEMPVVLLVEDNEDNIFVTTQFCKEICMLHSATSGLEALDLVSQNSYELILMDINLGAGINGLEVVQEIRKKKGYKNVPVIALTGLTFREDQARLLAGGCDYFLGKPFTKTELVSAIQRVLAE